MPSPEILFIASCWPHAAAFGGQLRALHTVRALKAVGNLTFTVVTSDAEDADLSRRAAAEFDVGAPIRAVLKPNRGIVDKLRWALDPSYLNLHGYVSSLSARRTLIDSLPRYDLVWILNSRIPNILQHWRWPRSHLDIDDVPSTYFRASSETERRFSVRLRSRIYQSLLKRREMAYSRRFTTLSVCSEADRCYLGGGDRIHVIPNGFECPPTTPVSNPVTNPPRIGFIGLCTYTPNIDALRWFLEDIWPIIRLRVPGIRLRLVGKGTDQMLNRGTADVDAFGWVEDPAEEIASWSAMVVPIRLGGGTRVKIADAFSRKCPVVSTSLGAFGYEVEDGNQLRLADTAAAFANACIELVFNRPKAIAMAERAWSEFQEKWTWDAIRPKVWAAAEDCLRRGAVRSSATRVGTSPDSDSHLVCFDSTRSTTYCTQADPPSMTDRAKERVMILMPTYNRSKVLSQTLDAICQTDLSGIDLEIVVIDNNSSDDTSQIVSAFKDRLPLILLREPRPGKNCALNRALQERALRNLVVLIDDDITPDRDWLQQMISASKRWPDVSAFGGRVNIAWPNDKQPTWVVAEWLKVFGFAWHDLGSREMPYEHGATPMGPCYWVRKEVFSSVPRFDETIGPRPTNRIMGSEVSFLMELERNGFKMVYCPRVMVEHRIQPEDCRLPPLIRRAFRYGRGEVRLYGIHRAALQKNGKYIWNIAIALEVLSYSGLCILASVLAPTRRRRTELAVRAAIRLGKITESSRIARGKIS